jgi:hypothetical protein
VRLVSSDGASATLYPVAYQFQAPRPTANGDHTWDANWLMVRGEIHTADGRQWEFLDPCLTTWEAQALSAWLHRAAGSDAAIDRQIAFTEPNLAFISERRAGHERLQVCFCAEALPPWASHQHDGPQTGEYVLTLDISHEDLAHAARAWDRENEQFTER